LLEPEKENELLDSALKVIAMMRKSGELNLMNFLLKNQIESITTAYENNDTFNVKLQSFLSARAYDSIVWKKDGI
jgi:hypothetical protein